MAQAGLHWRKETVATLDKHVGRCEVLTYRGAPNAWLVFPMEHCLRPVKDARDGLGKRSMGSKALLREGHITFTQEVFSRHMPDF